MFRLERVKRLVKKRKTIGRGGERGGTSGRGGKGQTARSGGNTRIGFEGGQMPLFRRIPRRGFNNAQFKRTYAVVNLERIDATFADGATVTRQDLISKGLVKSRRGLAGTCTTRIKILGSGTLTKRLTVSAHAFSESAKQAIVRAGGQAHVEEV